MQPSPEITELGPCGGFAGLLVRHRVRLGLTQEELAERSGLNVRTIGNMERGRALRPQRRSVEAIAAVLGLTGEQLADFLAATRPRPLGEPSSVERLAVWEGGFPARPSCFVGREIELTTIHWLAEHCRQRRGPTLVCVDGAPGVGKTAFATSAGYRIAELFPDGQFFLHLRTSNREALEPAEALLMLLRAAGVPDQLVPPTVGERSALFRSVMHDRRALIVLDDAVDEARIRPLLPSGSGCLVLITGRRQLAGLHGASQITLDVLAPGHALDMLHSVLGREHVDAQLGRAREVAELCGRLPLALRIAVNQFILNPQWTLTELVMQLRDERFRLKLLSDENLGVRSAFELSYRQLAPELRAVFQKLCITPGPCFSTYLAAELCGIDVDAADAALEELAKASLVTVGQGQTWALHDLLRIFSRERLAEESPQEIESAVARMDGWVVRATTRAASLIHPGGTPPPPATGLWPMTTRAEAIAWFNAVCSGVLAVAERMAGTPHRRGVLALAEAMRWYADIRPFAHRWDELFRLAAEVARAEGDAVAEATQLNFLAWSLYSCGSRCEEAREVAERAGGLAERIGDSVQQGWSLVHVGALSDPEEAVEPLRRAIELFRDGGCWLAEHLARVRFGGVLVRLGRFEVAEEIVREVIAVARGDERSSEVVVGWALLSLGDCLAGMRRWAEAGAAYGEAAQVLEFWQYRVAAERARSAFALSSAGGPA